MLPGFRLLVAAVVLCLSLLVFGFGATALLRSARENVASLPVRRAAPQTVFASQPPPDAAATLSMLRVETPEASTATAADAPAAAVPHDIPAPEPEPARQASLIPDAQPADARARAADPAPNAPALEQVAPVETLPAAVPAVAAPAAPRADEPTMVAAIAPPTATDQPVSTLTAADTEIAVMNIATLGGPAVDIEPVPLPKAKPVAEPAKRTTKPKKAAIREKPAKRRRLDARAEAPAPAPAETFGWQQPQR
ncbi:hypothetical protein FNL55_09470 [Tardiphaga sp. vice352]|uniref:hypothetical protein n=1 Tax=unclassified Tardiphaga TaxID=2631404 RepID=UPI0011634FE6|nr:MULTISPECIES: hypothetical protein [unclassified Tardiphaga]MBC7585389.1 hypothetical protein [Tardiphaga sp.]QDM16227.1 hypothetical protein FNL53_10140 [Tardiphaga sp. vice278]QDM21252.1 hypothetical protein FIU28_09060 [Tardiphaga sp. vice154]QDM26437.1 hypothetical protein FNL56_10305 [Tardiphaga sp. vice304]QDM31503.1 hypothetical protein FNL55_09470 [Tardiphaga sp. vice352]